MSLRRDLPDVQWEKSIYVLMTKFNWDLHKIKTLPISTFMEIQKLMEWEAKEQERRHK